MIAKALSHESEILFLDEPSAGVDVELRKLMWEQVRELRESGVTIILTTHYIEEAEEMADHIGIINKGKLILTENKNTLMDKMGKRQMIFVLQEAIAQIPTVLNDVPLTLGENGSKVILTYNIRNDYNISEILDKFKASNIRLKDIYSCQSSLEEIFIELMETL